MSVVMEISDHVVVLDYGVKIADGRGGWKSAMTPTFIKAYLGVDDAAKSEPQKRDRISA